MKEYFVLFPLTKGNLLYTQDKLAIDYLPLKKKTIKAAKPKAINNHAVWRKVDLQIGGDIKVKSTDKFWYSLPKEFNQISINFHSKGLIKFINQY